MKILLVIDAPDVGKEWGRAEQFRCTALSKMGILFFERLVNGISPCKGTRTQDGVTLHFQIEETPAPVEGKAA